MKKYLRFLPVIFWMLLIFVASSVPDLKTGEGPPHFLFRKLVHIIEYAVLFWFWIVALGKSKSAVWWSLILTVTYGILDETHQLLVPTRDGKLVDVLIDSLGATVGWLGICVPRRLLGTNYDSN